MKNITSLCEINDGQLKIIRKREFELCIKDSPNGRYFLTLKKIYKKRSLNQNAYYHGVVIPLVKDGLFDVGYKLSNDQVHEYLKETFLRTEITNEDTGEVIKINRSTTELSTVEFMEYIDTIIEWASDYLSITIPLPDQFYEN